VVGTAATNSTAHQVAEFAGIPPAANRNSGEFRYGVRSVKRIIDREKADRQDGSLEPDCSPHVRPKTYPAISKTFGGLQMIPKTRAWLGATMNVMVLVLIATPQAAGPALAGDLKPAAKTLKILGRIEPSEQVQVFSRILGFVQKVNVDIGDRVKAGQLLAEQSVPELEADVKLKVARVVVNDAQVLHAQLLLKESKATWVAVSGQIKEAKARVKSAQTRLDEATKAHEHAEKLHKEKSVAAKFVEERAAQVELAKAALEEAQLHVLTVQATLEGSQTAVEASEIGIKTALAQRDAARAEAAGAAAVFSYSKIAAPFDGVITQRAADVGALAGPPNARSKPLFTVARVDKVRVVALVPQADASHLRVGSDAVVTAGKQQLKGKVSRTAGAIEVETGSLRVEIDLANADGKLLPGMSVEVSLALTEPSSP
jgi:multidrug efflux pump subunit AcrA (membrane-fusion protein)